MQAIMEGPWYKQRWPWFLMAGPAAVVVAGSFTCWLAFTRQDAMVVGDYYRQGKAINQDLRRDRVASQLGLTARLQYDAAHGVLSGRVLGAGMSVPGRVRILLAHSTQPEKDIPLLAQPNEDGRFALALPRLDTARWQVTIESEQRAWRLGGVWQWPHQGVIDIQADAMTPADD